MKRSDILSLQEIDGKRRMVKKTNGDESQAFNTVQSCFRREE